MKRITMPLLSASVAILGVAVVCEALYLARLENRLSDLRKELASVRVTPTPVASAAVPELRSEASEPATASDPPPLSPSPAAPVAPPPSLSPEERRDLESLIDKKVEEKVKAQKSPDGKKPPLSEVTRDAGIDPVTQSKMAQVLNAAKDEAFALLRSPRLDGGNFVDDFVSAMTAEKPEETAGKVWLRLFSEKIPGTEETYVARVMTLQKSVNDSLKTMLTPQQYESYEHMALDPLQIQTGYDPFAEYFLQKGVPFPD